MKIDEVRELISLIEHSSINVLELRRAHDMLRLEMADKAEPQNFSSLTELKESEKFVASAVGKTLIKAPGFGIFSSRHPSGKVAFSQEGQQINAGDTLGILRINEICTPIVSSANGRLHFLVQDDELVGYAAPLFEIVPV